MDKGISELKGRIDLRDIIRLPGDGGRRSGEALHGLCPFHEADGGQHKTESFMVYSDHYYCLSPKCQARGDVFNWFAWETFGVADGPVKGVLFAQIRDMLVERYASGEMVDHPPPQEERKKFKLTDKDRSGLTRLAYACHRQMASKQLTYFYGRGFSPDTISRQLFGFDGQRYVIPIWKGTPRKSKLLTLRFRSSDPLSEGSRYSGIKHYNDQMLYNREALLWSIKHSAPALLVFYGEFDAALAWQDGFPAVSPTNGALSFLPEWLVGYGGEVIIVPDKGEEKAAYVDANGFDKGHVAHFPKGPFKDYGEFRNHLKPVDLMRCIYRDTGVLVKRRNWAV